MVGVSFLSGCATHWAVNDYGRIKPNEYFHATGPVHGDATRVYAQGELHLHPYPDTRGKISPAYLAIALNEGQILSKEINEGDMPPAAFDYPTIGTPYRYDKAWFIESGRDIGNAGGWSLYIKNPNDPDTPTLIFLNQEHRQYPRSTSAKVFYPVVLTGAVVADIIATPVYVIRALGAALVVLFVGVA